MKFLDIPQMTLPGYNFDHHLYMLPKTMKDYESEQLCPLNTDPDFQRIHVWTPEQQTKYIEFLLQGGNSGKDLYFNCPGWQGSYEGPFELVDGKQRLEACLGFMRGSVPIFGGLFIGDFVDKPREQTLRFHINTLQTRAEVLRWYIDLNSGGVVHTKDELDRVRALLEKEISNGN